ncbi:MAG TPA: LuxR family transcriptional regulator [Rhodospirillaceae bacterium]|nr:LuxR family transcriptional regulator [Rhodospirillaceae bacterium]
MFVDSHCHLDFGASDADLSAVLDRARAVGVERFVTVGTNRAEFPEVVRLSEAYADVFCALGIHPHEAEKVGEEISAKELVDISAHQKIIGIGEAGLDYFYDNTPKEAQERVFREHIRASILSGLPLIIHTRDAEEDTIRILSEERKGHEKELKGVFHCYSSNKELAAFGQEIDFYFSFSGMLTFKKSDNVRDIAQDIALDRLLVETDAPYLAPEPFRGKKCEPAYVVHTAKCLADVKGLPIDMLEKATTENFFRLFKKVKAP